MSKGNCSNLGLNPNNVQGHFAKQPKILNISLFRIIMHYEVIITYYYITSLLHTITYVIVITYHYVVHYYITVQFILLHIII